MNKAFKILFLSLFFCWPCAGYAQEVVVPAAASAPVPMIYGINYATIQYEISGAEVGKEVMYFDKSGLRQAHFRSAETPRWGMMNTVTLNLQEEIIYFDPSKNLGQKKIDENLKRLLADTQSVNNGLLAMQLVVILGGTKAGEETILDKMCEVWDIPASKVKLWLWKGIVLKSETVTGDGVVTLTASSIDESTVIDEAVFVVPPATRFIDRDINQILISKR